MIHHNHVLATLCAMFATPISAMMSARGAPASALTAAPTTQLARTPFLFCSAVDAQLATEEDDDWHAFAEANGIVAPKLSIKKVSEDARGKGGVFAKEAIAPMEVVATIPRSLVLTASEQAMAVADRSEDSSWASALTAAALIALHEPSPSASGAAKKEWISEWVHGGWATLNSDLGAPGVQWGADYVTGNLMATGSDNDKNIYAKFRFPCHPVVHRAGLGLAQLTSSDKKAALEALQRRGRAFRGMRDALIPLVETPTLRAKGSQREKSSWDVADALSRVLSRATALQLADDQAPTVSVVPLHERLAHCGAERGENVKVVGCDPRSDGDEEAVLLVATRAIECGEALTRDYNLAPRLPDDDTEGALRLLLQFGLPPAAW